LGCGHFFFSLHSSLLWKKREEKEREVQTDRDRDSEVYIDLRKSYNRISNVSKKL
jgi:gamma-glutamylcysteine synthetase